MRGRGQGARAILLAIFLLTTNDQRLTTNIAFADGTKYSFAAMERAFLEGRYQKAADEASALIDERASNREEIYYLKGLSELKLCRYQAARKSFQAIIARYAFSKRIFDAYIGLGDSYYLDKDMNAAIKSYEDAVFKFPNDDNIAIAYFRLAKCHADKGDGVRANEFYGKAKKAAPLSFEARKPLTVAASRAPDMAPAVTAATGGGEHSVQVGYFRSRANAEKLSQKLRLRGYDAYVEASSGSEGRFYRTKIGRYKTVEEAVKASENLREKGYSTKVCAGDVCR